MVGLICLVLQGGFRDLVGDVWFKLVWWFLV